MSARRFTLVPIRVATHIGVRPATPSLLFRMKDFPPEAPRLDPVPFIVADVLLVIAAAFIGWQAQAPLGVAPLASISALIGLGAVAGLYPFVVNHARRQEESLQERANQIEALARTVDAAVEQISIAAANLPAISEQATRQLRIAEQFPADIQVRLAALQHQLSATASEENAALRHELDTLRAAETGKLSTALEGINHATSDLARLEALVAKHSAALDSAFTHFPRLAENFGQQASDVLRRETAAAISALHAAAAESSAALAAANDEARAAFDRSVREAVAHLTAQAPSAPPQPVRATQPHVVAPLVSSPIAPIAPVAIAEIDDAGLDEPEAMAIEREPESATEPEAEPEAPAENISEENLSVSGVADEATSSNREPDAPSDADADFESATEIEPDATDALINPAEAALSHDGYTRLVATAYIGIGNKLFIRGDGPGLRRDKGVALQFVSIGKWRWESAELLFPVKAKLYKNDQLECIAVGEIELEPGHHHEVNATF